MQSTRFGQTPFSVENGVRQVFPLILGYTPIGVAYGLLAQQTGLGLWETLGMSLFVFAGASQFLAVSMIQNGVGTAAVVGATFIVNFRHVLMSASISPYIDSWKTWQRLLLGGMLTDESFALHSANFGRGDANPTTALIINITAYVTWAAAGAVGYNLGAVIANPKTWGLDFALPAMFIGLLLPACGNKAAVTAATVGGAVAVGLHLLNAGNWAAFVGALAGATAGVLFGVKEGGKP